MQFDAIARGRALPLVALMALGLSACGTDSAGTTAPPSASAPSASAGTCDQEAITRAVAQAYPQTEDERVDVLGVACEGDWALVAVNFVSLTTLEGDDEPYAYEAGLIMQRESTGWVEANSTEACGTAIQKEDGSTPDHPADAQVPAQLWPAACWAN